MSPNVTPGTTVAACVLPLAGGGVLLLGLVRVLQKALGWSLWVVLLQPHHQLVVWLVVKPGRVQQVGWV